MKAADIMTREVVSAKADTPVSTLARLMLTRRIGSIPIVDEHNAVIGIVSDHDLLRHPPSDSPRAWWLRLFDKHSVCLEEIATARNRLARDVMVEHVRTVQETIPIGVLGSLMQRHKLKHAPVVHDGKLVGIVSRSDLLAALLRDHGEAPVPSPAYRFFGE